MTFDPKELDHFPKKPGVYLMKNDSGSVLYVGKAKLLRDRLKQYFTPGVDNRAMIPFLIAQIVSIDTIITFTEKEALLLENTLIKKHQPKYNVLLKDDKSYISLVLNHKHEWPILRLMRFKGTPPEGSLHFGPYTSALAARQMHEIIAKIFPLRKCSDRELYQRKRPCILYSMKRCIAPCVKKCSHEEYGLVVKEVIQFLKGKSQDTVKHLEIEMAKASEALAFERAGAILRTLESVKEAVHTSPIAAFSSQNSDAFALLRKENYLLIVKLIFRKGHLIASEHYDFSLVMGSDEEQLSSFLLQHYMHEKDLPHEVLLPLPLPDQQLIADILKLEVHTPQKGEKKKLTLLALENAQAIYDQEQSSIDTDKILLLKMQELFKLTQLPARIECFDTSHISGSDTVASLVTYTDGQRDRKGYRLYKIESTKTGDDYAALREVLTRRYTKALEKGTLPSLLIVDGGKGQLNIAREVLATLNIATVDLIAVAKDDSRHDKGMTREKVFVPGESEPIILDIHSTLLFFLQAIRDEAHRFAITFHKERRTKRLVKSALDEIPGIGPKKRALLLKQFGSVKRIKTATHEELAALPGISARDIAALKAALKD